MPTSSTPSEQVFVPRREFSLWALAIWLIQHGLASAAIVLAAPPDYVKTLGGLLVAASLIYARPRRCSVLGAHTAGRWSLPEEALYELRLRPGTAYTQWWVLLRLRGLDGQCRTLRIWRDCLSAGDWRRLLVRLREYRPAPE